MNDVLNNRLESVRTALLAMCKGGDGLANAVIGHEREVFISSFLSSFFPQHYRFSSGTIIGSVGDEAQLSGQEDIIVEHPFNPSFPVLPQSNQRLVLAENVALVIEVKSDIGQEGQRESAAETVKKTHAIERRIRPNFTNDYLLKDKYGIELGEPLVDQTYDYRIPTFVVSYKGGKKVSTLEKYREEIGCTGIMSLSEGAFVVNNKTFKQGTGLAHFINCVNLLSYMLISCEPALSLYLD